MNTTKMNYPDFETSRVNLKVLTLDDAESVYAHFSDPDVTRFMDIEPCKSIEEAREIIDFHIKDSGCRWGIYSKTEGVLIGTCGFHCWFKGENSRAEIGFDLAKSFWGQGIMKETLEVIIKFGFEVMNLDLIEATVETGNERSQKLLEKLNFKKENQLKDNLFYYYLIR